VTKEETMADVETLHRWMQALAAELGLEAADVPDVDLVLDLAGTAAHAVARPAAPLTTFLVGVAATRSGRPLDDVAAQAGAFAERWGPAAGTE
jgi:hypothetical protein